MKYTNYNNSTGQNIPQTILPKIEVGDMLKDSKGNIWVSTLNNGVFVFLQDGRQVQKFAFKQQLQSEDTWYIRNKNNNLDIGYNQLIVDQLKNGLFYKRWIGDTTINLNPVTLFSHYRNKTILFGARSIYSEGFQKESILKAVLKAAYKDHYFYNGDMYISTSGSFIKFSPTLDFVFGKPQPRKFTSVFPVSDSVFAKGGANGLYLNDTPTQIKDRITKVRVYNNDILACTDNGLFIKRGEQYFHVTDKTGLPDNQCIQVEYYGDAHYKLLTKEGLAYIDQKNCSVTHVFNSQLLGKDIIIHHFDVENDSVWLATNKGVYVLDEQLIFNKEKKTVQAFLYPARLSNRNARYTQSTFQTKYSKTNQVKMLLELLDFSSNTYSVSYQVKKDENVTERSQVINNSFFVNTPEPGTYTVTVYIASNKNHIDKKLTYTIIITPLWYQTLWARLLFSVSILIVLWLAIRSITRYIIKGKEKKLKEKYAILQLQSQAFFTQLNPHFIFNALTPLQSHILKNEKIESLEYLDRFSSLMRDILKNSDKMETSLRKEFEFLRKYVAIQQIRFSPSFTFELNVNPAIDLENTSIPAMMLQPIIENAIEHGVKNMGAKGKIAVDIKNEFLAGKEYLLLEISDNGPGITGNILKEGHALYILQKRVQTLQKQAGSIASLIHEPGPGGIGATFKLILPYTSSLWAFD